MFYNLIENLRYCGEYVSEVSDLLIYSHVPVALIVLFVAFFIYTQKRDLLPSKILLVLGFVFAIWTVLNLTIWFSYDNASLLMFSWSLIEIFSALLFILSFYFVYVFLQRADLSPAKKVLLFLPILPILILAPTHFYLNTYDMQECIATEGVFYIEYVRWVKLGFSALILSYLGFSFFKQKTWRDRSVVFILSGGILAFLYSFLTAGYIAEQTLNYTSEFYGLFAIIVFIGSLGYLIVKYAAFDIRLVGAQALVVTLILLVGSRLFFSTNLTGFIISGITFLLVGIFGYFLIRSVKKEVALREELEAANKRQQETLRFITHEVKGYLTDGAAALDAILTETFGAISSDMKTMVGDALTKNRMAVREIQNFLRIADFKTGKVSYAVDSFDMHKALTDMLVAPGEQAKNRNLDFSFTADEGAYTITGDKDQLLNHVFGNLVHNAINYTPAGSVSVHLSHEGSMIRISVKDSGVGLSEDDKSVLFTEGGHGKESRAVNPHSTGYGLFIAKRIVDAHHGRIWAESQGRGTGSTFFVELPTSLSKKDFGLK